MTDPTNPVPRSRGGTRLLNPRTGIDATTALSVHLVLLLLVPSDLTIAAMAAYGRPSLIWGLLLLLWWMLSNLQESRPIGVEHSDPVRVAFVLFMVVVLASFASAMLRGQPMDQISPAMSALVRMASWSGVLLVALDGLAMRDQVVPLVRRLVIVGALLSLFGLAQLLTGRSFLEWISSVPGIQFNADETVSARGNFSRSAGVAVHPLEHLTVLVSILPLAIACGVSRGFSGARSRIGGLWWLPAALIMLSCLVSVSRSAILGLLVGFLASLPIIPKRQRWIVFVAGAIGAVVVLAAVPGMMSTIIYLFVNASDDPSAQSRADALSRLPKFMAASPLIGAGFGTFLPRYYIFDNQWVVLLVEVGLVGTLTFAGLLASGVWSAYRASFLFPTAHDKALGRAFAASVLALTTTYALFDAIAFPMSAGILFLTLGCCGALLRIARAEHTPLPSP